MKKSLISITVAAAFCFGLVASSIAGLTPGGVAFSLPNVALGGVASQDSTNFGGTPDKAIDNNTDGNFANGSVTHNNNPTAGAAFWQVVLAGGYDYFIDQITIWNRMDGGAETRLQAFDFEIVTPSGSTTIIPENYGGVLGPVTFTMPAGTVGHLVRVRQQTNNYLHMAEVQVFANSIPEPSTLALIAIGFGTCFAFWRRRK